MTSKAQGLSLNMIAVAIIVLIVVLVTAGIFTGAVNKKFVPFLNDRIECEKQQGQPKCVASGSCEDGTEIYGLGCEKTAAPYCCFKRG